MIKLTEPKVDERKEQPYVGIRKQGSAESFKTTIPELLGELFGWLGQRGIEPAGAPIMRYHVINMEADMDYEIGVPVASPVSGDERVKPGVIPAGRYASLIFTGAHNGYEGNKALIGWVREKRLEMDRWDVPTGDAFRSRVEHLLMGPQDDPDPANWDTEVAIKLKD